MHTAHFCGSEGSWIPYTLYILPPGYPTSRCLTSWITYSQIPYTLGYPTPRYHTPKIPYSWIPYTPDILPPDNLPSRYPYPSIPYSLDTLAHRYPNRQEGTWDQRWKHYLPETSLAGGNDTLLRKSGSFVVVSFSICNLATLCLHLT